MPPRDLPIESESSPNVDTTVPGEPVMVGYTPGCNYDPHTPLARQRRVEGLCGWCGHPTHNRMIGCEVCGPETCPVILEIWGEAAVKASEKMEQSDRAVRSHE